MKNLSSIELVEFVENFTTLIATNLASNFQTNKTNKTNKTDETTATAVPTETNKRKEKYSFERKKSRLDLSLVSKICSFVHAPNHMKTAHLMVQNESHPSKKHLEAFHFLASFSIACAIFTIDSLFFSLSLFLHFYAMNVSERTNEQMSKHFWYHLPTY